MVIPTDLVLQMRADGLSNNQIIQNLQRQNYDSNQIFDALSQADMKGNTQHFGDLVGQDEGQEASSAVSGPSVPQQAFPDMSSLQPQSMQMEEAIESAIDEKWGVFEENVKKIISWKNDVENRMKQVESRMSGLEDQMKTLHEGIFGKIGEYDTHIKHLGSELKAMDKVFQKVLPDLAENVAELGSIADLMKKKK